MTDLILKLFIKDDFTSAKSRLAIGRLSGSVGIVVNVILCILKAFIGFVSGSLSITADAMNNLTDVSSSLITLVGFKLSEKPSDDEHPYGHARFEYLSGLLVAALMILIGFEFIKSSFDKILHPSSVVFSIPLLVVLLLSILVKLWLAVFNSKLAKVTGSKTIEATSADSRNDVISTSAVLLATIIEALTSFQIDGYFGLAVAVFILISGIMTAKETISPLLGENADPKLISGIVTTVESNPAVLGYHDLMVHDYGHNQRFASMHIEMDSKDDPLVCHDIIDNIERECKEKYNVNLVIHYDPVVTGDKQLNELKSKVLSIVTDIDSRITIHDFRMVCGPEHTNLIFDIVIPNELNKKRGYIKDHINSEINKESATKFYTVITFDEAAFNM